LKNFLLYPPLCLFIGLLVISSLVLAGVEITDNKFFEIPINTHLPPEKTDKKLIKNTDKYPCVCQPEA